MVQVSLQPFVRDAAAVAAHSHLGSAWKLLGTEDREAPTRSLELGCGLLEGTGIVRKRDG